MMNRCVHTFEEHISESFRLDIEERQADDAIIYIISLIPKNGTEMQCAHGDHGAEHGEASISAEMVIDTEDDKKVARVTTVVVGCWSHGPAQLVDLDLKGCGVGTMLMLVCECIAIGAGADVLTLDDDSGISGFYESLGYDRPDGDEVMVKTPSVADWRMRVDKLVSKINSLVQGEKCRDIWKAAMTSSLGKRGRGDDDSDDESELAQLPLKR